MVPPAIGACAGDAGCAVDSIRKPCGDGQENSVASTIAERRVAEVVNVAPPQRARSES